jgi:hypothetical protein
MHFAALLRIKDLRGGRGRELLVMDAEECSLSVALRRVPGEF